MCIISSNPHECLRKLIALLVISSLQTDTRGASEDTNQEAMVC